MKKLIGTFVLVCVTLGANAQLLWKVSGNGLEQTSYIFGTHHLAPYSIMDSIRGLKNAFAATTQMIGELKMSDMQSSEAMGLMEQQMMMSDGKTIKELFTADEYVMVNKYVRENMRFELAQKPNLKPAFITNNIVLLLYMKNVPGYNPQEQLDHYFQVRALEVGMNVEALESMSFQVDLLFNSTSVERQAELLVCTLSDVDKTIGETKKLSEAYMAQDLNAILNIAMHKDGTSCDPLPEELEALIDNRNITWMEKLPALLQEQPSFIAVGALHLVGPKGLINLLKEAGYTVDPVK